MCTKTDKSGHQNDMNNVLFFTHSGGQMSETNIYFIPGDILKSNKSGHQNDLKNVLLTSRIVF